MRLLFFQKATTPDQIFIQSRILFLCTVSASPLIITLVEEKRHGKTLVDLLTAKMDMSLVAIHNGVKNSREAMTDLLKFTFYILMHYPKVKTASPYLFIPLFTFSQMSDTSVSTSETSSDGEVAIGDFWHPRLDG